MWPLANGFPGDGVGDGHWPWQVDLAGARPDAVNATNVAVSGHDIPEVGPGIASGIERQGSSTPAGMGVPSRRRVRSRPAAPGPRLPVACRSRPDSFKMRPAQFDRHHAATLAEFHGAGWP